MNIFRKIIEKFKKLFTHKEENVMLDIGKESTQKVKKEFKESVKVEKVRKRVQSHICYGDGLGIKKKLEY